MVHHFLGQCKTETNIECYNSEFEFEHIIRSSKIRLSFNTPILFIVSKYPWIGQIVTHIDVCDILRVMRNSFRVLNIFNVIRYVWDHEFALLVCLFYFV